MRHTFVKTALILCAAFSIPFASAAVVNPHQCVLHGSVNGFTVKNTSNQTKTFTIVEPLSVGQAGYVDAPKTNGAQRLQLGALNSVVLPAHTSAYVSRDEREAADFFLMYPAAGQFSVILAPNAGVKVDPKMTYCR